MVSRSEWRWCLGAGALVMALTCLPYLFVWGVTPPGMAFLGFLVNPDDQCVYLAWMKQASEGHFFLRNLWTADPQRGLNVHLLFWLLGVVARVTSLPLPLVYHAGRVVLGVAVLALFYRLAAFFTEEPGTRRTCFWLAALSAGFGFLFRGEGITGTVDWWQPEAITFQSLYTNTLFCAGLALMLGVVCGLLAAERTDDRRHALLAGLAGALLANIHSYDVITLAAVWTAYLVLRSIVERRLPLRLLHDSLLAAAVALPAVAYQFYVFYNETVFRQRAELTITHSPELWRLVLGYGLLVPLAVWGAVRLLRGAEGMERNPQRWLPVVWAVVGLAVPYLPVSYQRKMVMGLHLPLSLLAGIGLVHLAQLALARAPKTVAGRARNALVAAVILLTAPTNAALVLRHVSGAIDQNLSSNNLHPVYWPATEFEALRWADGALTGDPVLQALTVTAALIPPLTGNRVWAGHWSETPGFAVDRSGKIYEVNRFFGRPMPPPERERFLRDRGITHLLFGPRERALDRAASGQVEAELRAAPFLEPLHTTGTGDLSVTVYRVRRGNGTG